jgi:predicted RNA binding protein YcfA (HicA-like mRNA interferase family)
LAVGDWLSAREIGYLISNMSRREKLRRKLRQQPADATMQDVETLLQRFGFILARIRGSHHIFDYDDGERFQQTVVPLHGRRVKKIYVERIIALLDELFPPEVDEVEDQDEEND